MKASVKKVDKRRPLGPYMNLSTEERLDLLADIVIDRILEEEKLYKERLKTDPNAKRIFELYKCGCRDKRSR